MSVQRNDPCPCGSGSKYEHCCPRLDRAAGPTASGGAEARRAAQAASVWEAELLSVPVEIRDVRTPGPWSPRCRRRAGAQRPASVASAARSAAAQTPTPLSFRPERAGQGGRTFGTEHYRSPARPHRASWYKRWVRSSGAAQDAEARRSAARPLASARSRLPRAASTSAPVDPEPPAAAPPPRDRPVSARDWPRWSWCRPWSRSPTGGDPCRARRARGSAPRDRRRARRPRRPAPGCGRRGRAGPRSPVRPRPRRAPLRGLVPRSAPRTRGPRATRARCARGARRSGARPRGASRAEARRPSLSGPVDRRFDG